MLKKGPEIVLGVPMGKGLDKSYFWTDKIEKVKKRLLFWKLRDLTMFGKVHIIKSTILPFLQYASAHISIKKDLIKSVQNLIWKFVWEWKTCFVSQSICYLPRSMGGLNIPNFDLCVKASRVRMVIDIVQNPSKWNIISKKYLCVLDECFDIQRFALLVDDSSDEILQSNIPAYYKECLLAFQEMNRKGRQDIENSILWCNRKIKFQNKPLSFKHWSKSGIKYIGDVVKNHEIDANAILEKLNHKSGFIFEY